MNFHLKCLFAKLISTLYYTAKRKSAILQL